MVHAMGMRSQCGAVLCWCVVQYKMDYTSYLCLTRLLHQDTMMNPEDKVPLRCPLRDTANRTSKFSCLIGLDWIGLDWSVCGADFEPLTVKGYTSNLIFRFTVTLVKSYTILHISKNHETLYIYYTRNVKA